MVATTIPADLIRWHEVALMEIRTQSVTVRGKTYTVKELTAADMMALWSTGDDVGQMQMMAQAITVDGEPVEDIEQLPAPVFVKLMPLFTELNQFGDEGND